VPVVRQAKEIECQKCRKYKVAVPKTKWVKECNPVYDEQCKTEYHQHCKEETRCHIIYQTICDNSGYQQVISSEFDTCAMGGGGLVRPPIFDHNQNKPTAPTSDTYETYKTRRNPTLLYRV
jgi:hypothetical protein